jgi:hypothetical protein
MGGQGMNLGIQDAHNLAWRLTAAVRAQRGDATRDVGALLDGYEAERRPAGERVLEDVRAQMALVTATGADGAALRSRMEALLAEHAQVNLQYARRLSGVDVRYPVARDSGDTRLGARVPDLLLDGDANEPTRLYDVLREIGPGRCVRLTVAKGPADGDSAAEPGAETVPDLDVTSLAVRSVTGPDWALREGWGAPGTLLLRPDGHVTHVLI